MLCVTGTLSRSPCLGAPYGPQTSTGWGRRGRRGMAWSPSVASGESVSQAGQRHAVPSTLSWARPADLQRAASAAPTRWSGGAEVVPPRSGLFGPLGSSVTGRNEDPALPNACRPRTRCRRWGDRPLPHSLLPAVVEGRPLIDVPLPDIGDTAMARRCGSPRAPTGGLRLPRSRHAVVRGDSEGTRAARSPQVTALRSISPEPLQTLTKAIGTLGSCRPAPLPVGRGSCP